MTSATAGSTPGQSRAAQDLDLVLLNKRVPLSELTSRELDEFLTGQLCSVDIKRLHGFHSISDVFYELHKDLTLYMSADMDVATVGFDDIPILNPKSQVILVCGGHFTRSMAVYRRHEFDGETIDPEVFRGWGKSGYMYSAIDTALFILRSERPTAENMLIEVQYSYTKIPCESKYMINTLRAKVISASKFSGHYKEQASRLARQLIWDISTIYRKTADEMQQKATGMREKSMQMEMIAHRIG